MQMDLQTVIKLDLWQKTLHRSITLIMRRPLSQQLVSPRSEALLLLLLLNNGRCFKWMSRMPFSMGIYQKKCICNLFLAMITHPIKFVAKKRLFMASSKRPEHGLPSSVLLFLNLAFNQFLIIMHCLFERLLRDVPYFFFMLMT